MGEGAVLDMRQATGATDVRLLFDLYWNLTNGVQ